jgi:ABC-type Fe3+ transport system permease subunit
MSEQPADLTNPPPPRAFSQGAGTIFQTVGATLFLVFTFFCCGSALTSKQWATRPDRENVGWRSSTGHIVYSERHWSIATVFGGVLFGLGVAGIGLGLQADKRPPAAIAPPLTALAAAFWTLQAAFAAQALRSIVMTIVCAALAAISAILCGLSIGALRDLSKNPPAAGHDILPADFKEPFSHLHQDSPEARLAAEIAQRRQRLEVEQKELDALERRLRRKLEQK